MSHWIEKVTFTLVLINQYLRCVVMAYVLVTRLICLMFLFILSLYILLVKGYLIFMSIL